MTNTVLVTTSWLEHSEYNQKTEKFIKYYKPHFDNIVVIDNGSKFYGNLDPSVHIMTQVPFLPRKTHLEYPYLWRAIYGLNICFDLHPKVVYMDNDFYITSRKMMDWVNSIDSGWNTTYCNAYNFNETGFQVVHKDCEAYNKFVQDGEFWKHNGKVMENTLPVTNVNKNLIGNRWSELGITTQYPDWDFSAQTPLHMEIKFNE